MVIYVRVCSSNTIDEKKMAMKRLLFDPKTGVLAIFVWETKENYLGIGNLF